MTSTATHPARQVALGAACSPTTPLCLRCEKRPSVSGVMCARCKSTLEARKERESKPVHPAHQANREKLAARIVDALFTRVFGDRTPTGDEVRNVASTTMLHRGSWVQLAGLTGNGSMSRETRALVLGELINRAEDLDAAAEARAA